MTIDINVILGFISTVMLGIIGYFFKRILSETDKLLNAHQDKLRLLAGKLDDLTKEQAIMNERMIRLMKIDEKFTKMEHDIVKLLDHEASFRKRYHDIGNYLNRIVGILSKNNIAVDELFSKEPWHE